MQRFGRSAQQRLKDRWGGGFILATILALMAAWYVGDSLGTWINGSNNAAVNPMDNTGTNTMPAGGMTMEPAEFKMHFVQVGAFLSGKNARDMVEKMAAVGYAAVIAPKNNSGFQAVWVGPFMDATLADDARAKLTEAGMKPVLKPVMVGYNTNAVPVAATGTEGTDYRMVLDNLNMYMRDVAVWMDLRAQGMAADTTAISAHGRELSNVAAMLAGETDANVVALATLASDAAANAAAIESATTADPTEQMFQEAMTQYLGLVDQYNAFQMGK
jgi:hypothetical protein